MCFISFNKLWTIKLVSLPFLDLWRLAPPSSSQMGLPRQLVSTKAKRFQVWMYSYTFFTLKTSYWREKVDEYCRNGKQPINGEENVLNSQLVYNFCVIEVEVTEIMTDT